MEDTAYEMYSGSAYAELQRAGTFAQRRHTRRTALIEPGDVPALPASPPPLPKSLPLLPRSRGSSVESLTPKDSPATSAADIGSPDSGAFPPSALPEPYLPLRKSSANRLRLQTGQSPSSSPKKAFQSPTPSTASESRNVSPRSKDMPPPPLPTPTTTPIQAPLLKDGEVYASPTVLWGRARGLTTNSPLPPNIPHLPSPRLKESTSIPDFRLPKRISSTYQPNRGPNARDANPYMREPPVPWREAEEVRSSFRSALTNGETRSSFRSAFTNGSAMTYASSGYIDASETERSSVLTRASSTSDNEQRRQAEEEMEEMEEEGLSVDDVMDLYADGFDESDSENFEESFEDAESYLGLDGTEASGPKAEASSSVTPPLSPAHSIPHRELDIPKSPSAPHLPYSPLESHPPVPPTPSSPKTPSPRSSPAPAISPQTSPVLGPKMTSIPPVPRDRYGFKKETQHVSAAEYDKWNATYEPYVERRRKKWIHLMRSNDLPTDKPFRFPAKSDKVKRFVRKGIPPEWRGAAWFWYAGGPARMVEQPRLYWNLLDMATEGKLNDVDREHIERDLNRTFPDNIRFKPDTMPEVSDDERPGLMGKQGEPPMISALRRVLQAFAIHNPHVGYCQSLNFIAGLLLLFLDMDEEKSFIMLDIITRDHLPGIHNKTLEDIDMGVLMSYIQESMPAVWSKIDDADDMGGTASAHLVTRRLPTIHLTTTAWFMTCFVGNLPIETVLRVWDSFWFEGSKTLFRIALTLFKAVETNVRALTDHMEIMQTVQAIPRRWIDANSLMEQCFRRRGGFGHVSLDSIQARREQRRAALLEARRRSLNGAGPVKASSASPVSSRRIVSRGRRGM